MLFPELWPQETLDQHETICPVIQQQTLTTGMENMQIKPMSSNKNIKFLTFTIVFYYQFVFVFIMVNVIFPTALVETE